MTLKELYQFGTTELERAGIEECALDAWYLLEHVIKISRAMYFADANKQAEEEKKDTYVKLIQKRAAHIPLQHLTGVQEFMGLEFDVNEHVLIPRQDTEILVETALDVLERRILSETDRPEQLHILDMCTGSGCILLSILHYIRNKAVTRNSSVSAWEGTITGCGVDISAEALKVAVRNAKKLQIETDFLKSDLFADVYDTYDMIVSNPPYIRTEVIKGLQEEVKNHDPMLALDGKEDGLYFYRRIVDESRAYLTKGGTLFFEIGHDQAEDVSEIMNAAGFQNVAVKKDLAGLDRVVFGVYDTKR